MRTIAALACVVLALLPISAAPAANDDGITKSWAMAEFGEPKYGAGFAHWPYANPDAPRDGNIVLAARGSFDSLNAIILKGDWPRSIGLTMDGLMAGSGDELSSAYGLIAETVEYPQDKSWIIFNIRPEARFHDGTPITAHDFKFAFDTIMEVGRPFLKSFYEDVSAVEVLSDHRLKFSFKTRDRMKPLLLVSGFVPLPRHYWADKDISKTTLEPPVGSGAYRIKRLEPGRSITYERLDDYWAADLPVNRGRYNFQEIRYDYYRDADVMFEAFKAGEFDFRVENSSKRWATGYDISQVETDEIVLREVRDETPRGIQAYFFNLRRPKFHDIRMREAIGLLYDFEAIQRTLLYGQYRRTMSYFPNSDFGAKGKPDAAEIAILAPFKDQLAPEVLTEAFEPPVTDASGRIRNQMRRAIALFREAGWHLKDGKLVPDAGGEQFAIEFLLASPDSERLAAPFVRNLRRAGIDATIRIVDSSQFQVRLDDFDFDIMTVALNFFPPPGPELRSYYGSAAADIRGSANMGGIRNPVVDALIEQIIAAEDLETLEATSRAMDRVLLWGHYVIPQFFNDKDRLAYWNKFGFPERKPRYGHAFTSTWWVDPTLEAELAAR